MYIYIYIYIYICIYIYIYIYIYMHIESSQEIGKVIQRNRLYAVSHISRSIFRTLSNIYGKASELTTERRSLVPQKALS